MSITLNHEFRLELNDGQTVTVSTGRASGTVAKRRLFVQTDPTSSELSVVMERREDEKTWTQIVMCVSRDELAEFVEDLHACLRLEKR